MLTSVEPHVDVWQNVRCGVLKITHGKVQCRKRHKIAPPLLVVYTNSQKLGLFRNENDSETNDTFSGSPRQYFPAPPFSGLELFLLWSNQALKVGGGVLSCVVNGACNCSASTFFCVSLYPPHTASLFQAAEKKRVISSRVGWKKERTKQGAPVCTPSQCQPLPRTAPSRLRLLRPSARTKLGCCQTYQMGPPPVRPSRFHLGPSWRLCRCS